MIFKTVSQNLFHFFNQEVYRKYGRAPKIFQYLFILKKELLRLAKMTQC